MQYLRLGNSGLKVSRLCLGTMTFGSKDWNPWVISEEDSHAIIRYALEAGINFFDTADVYSTGKSEEILGKALKEMAKRDQVIIATKVNGPMGPGPNDRGLSRKHMLEELERSLRRLDTDYIDLYQIHRWDYETPIEETLEALNDLVRMGKVRYLGASSMFAWEFARSLYLADRHGWTRFISMQNHYNLVYREEEREMIPLCRAEGIGLIPWSPLAKGFLAGNRCRPNAGATFRAQTDEYAHRLYYREGDFVIVDRVLHLARHYAATPAQIALAWLWMQSGVVAPVLGVTTVDQLREGLAASPLKLTEADCQYLEETYQPHPVLGHP
jgi:1-deoxyxylulose-5-phosphate synthase